ncbi:MAG TPA: septal ring lytic transglycosylase RlpA family protein [Spirochaetota bacterium]|nr:septal ring lytic transglycosylase RlpA family protein [Spirochaetota bacterium]HPV41517.1 septal ring lytic transglycosylase RlpA family protein [Spirochaetota bacterium]
MRSIVRNGAFMLAGILVLFFLASCATDNSYAKQRDYRTVKAGDKADSEFEEENNDFGTEDSKGDAIWSNKKSGNEDEGDRQEGDSSYKKGVYYQTGLASWYGREFNGKKTASGERFDMNGLTAAHKSLPFGTVLKVKNFDNGKTVTVRVNDRGPYRGKRIIDLSYGAAKKLGMIKDGQTQVGIQIVKKGGDAEENDRDMNSGKNGDIEAVSDETGSDTPSDSGSYAVQAGAFYSRHNAEQLKSRIEGLTGKPVVIVNDGDMFKVRIEGLESKHEVNRLKKSLSNEDIPSYMIKKHE